MATTHPSLNYLLAAVVDRGRSLGSKAAHVRRHMDERLAEHHAYIRVRGDDLPAIGDRRWRL